MASRRKPTKKPDLNHITAAGKPDEDQAVARTVLRPIVQAAVTLKEYGKSYGDLDLSGLDRFTDGADPCQQRRRPEAGRGHAYRAGPHPRCHLQQPGAAAINAEYMDNLDHYLKLAPRAQSRCWATWEALATIKNPPVMGYVRQANIAHGPQ